MRKIFTLILGLLISTVCLQAQDAKGDKTPGLETIEGCLQHSAGQYTLIDSSNTIHHLTGGGSKLSRHIGHQVEITGKPGVRTLDTTPQGGASAAVVQPIIEVKSVKHIAETCTSHGD